jgi:small-conductance mechanosensitive channel
MKPWVIKLAVTTGYFVLVTLLRGKTDWAIVGGGFLGIFLIDLLDRLAFITATQPSLPSSTTVRQNLFRLQLKPLFAGWEDFEKSSERTLHNVIFQLALVLLALYALFINASSFVLGLIFGTLIHLLLEQSQEFKKFGNLTRWFFLTTFRPTPSQAFLYLVSFFIVFLILSVQLGGK